MGLKTVKLDEIDPPLARREIEEFLVRKVLDAGATGGVVGLSGGVDSSAVAFLAASAFSAHNARSTDASQHLRLIGLSLPSGVNSTEDDDCAREVGEMLDIDFREFRIQPLVDCFAEKLPEVLNDTRHTGNLASEVRAVILSRHAAAHNCLILGTGNRDEDYCLGYFTKRGDGAVDVSPIGALSKRHVRTLAMELGVPPRIVTRVSTAGLWAGQTDEGELGFSYEIAEIVLAGHAQGLDAAALADEAGCDASLVERVLSMHRANRHKMSMPEVAPITYM